MILVTSYYYKFIIGIFFIHYFVLCKTTTEIMKSVLIVSPVITVYEPNGGISLGDELLVLGAINALKCSGKYDNIGIAVSQQIPTTIAGKSIEHFIIEYGNSICNDNNRNVSLHNVYTSYVGVVKFAPNYDLIAFIGADCMDGYYSCGRSYQRWHTIFKVSNFTSSYLISTSFELAKAQHCPQILQILKSPPTTHFDKLKIFARDSPSFQSMREVLSPALTNTLYGTADLAFNVHLDKNISNHFASQMSNEANKDKRVTIGVNVNIHKSSHISLYQFIPHVLNTLCEINNKKKLRIVYIPHDYRNSQSDIDVGNQFITNISTTCPSLAPYVYHERTKMLNAIEAKSIMAACDLVLTARMHVSISTISSGVPVLILGAHQTKFQYLERLFDLHSSVVSKTSRAMTDQKEFMKIINNALDTLPMQRENIIKNLPEVISRARMFALM